MKKILLIIIVLTATAFLFFKGYLKQESEELMIPVVTEEEKAQIIETAGETKTEQTEYVESLEVSKDDSLDTLEKELDETVILEEEFVELE